MKNWKSLSRFFILGIKDFQFSNEAKSFLKQYPVSGLALFNSPFDTEPNIWKNREAALETVYEFSKQTAPFVRFLAVDQEGGRVQRLRGHFIRLPSAQRLSEVLSENPENILRIEKLYALAAEQLAFSGIQLNFAPVCDLAYTNSNDIIGDRSFGRSIPSALPLISSFCRSFETAGVHTTLKHFPGHGASRFDSHKQVARLDKPRMDILREDTALFERAAPLASAIMPGHLAFEEEPETILSLDRNFILSSKRKFPSHLAWITDDLLQMKAVSDCKPWLSALDAEYDFILLCGDTLAEAAMAIDESIQKSEREVSQDFKKEDLLIRRLKRSSAFFSTPSVFLDFAKFKENILRLENEGLQLLHRLGIQDS